MKLDNLKQLVKEELKRALNENGLFNSLKVGETVKYMGENHKVVNKNEAIVTLERNKTGKTFNLNSNQVKEKVRRSEDYMNENDSSEFDYEKAIQTKMDEPSFLGDLELGATYEVEYGARDLYGDKDTGTTKISITQKDLDKYKDKDISIQNYLTDQFNINPKTGENINTGYIVNNIKSVKKLKNQSFNESLTPEEEIELDNIEDIIRYKGNSYGTSGSTNMKERYAKLISKRDKSLKK